MSYIGTNVDLEIERFTSVGAFISDKKEFEVLLPNKYLTDDMELGKSVHVFIYNDSEDRPVATTETPKILLNQFAFLTVKNVGSFGAFLDWGLEKDLLSPFKEQAAKMVEGGSYLVYLLRDEKTDRLVASSKINKFLSDEVENLNQGDKVSIFIAEETELGRKVIINNKYKGLVFSNHITRPLNNGDITDGYIEFIRQDGKIDVSLSPIGNEKFDLYSTQLLEYINKQNGCISITDKSDPDLIRRELNMSKKSFKKAVGNLYKHHKILIHSDTIELIK